MGTRSLVVIMDDDGQTEITTIYRQYDGYPEGMGADLKRFLGSAVLVNGYGSGDPKPRFNGMGCLAASLVGFLKQDKKGRDNHEGFATGNVYLYPPGTRDAGEEYVYTLTAGPKAQDQRKQARTINLKVSAYERTIYDGPIADFDPAKAEQDSAD